MALKSNILGDYVLWSNILCKKMVFCGLGLLFMTLTGVFEPVKWSEEYTTVNRFSLWCFLAPEPWSFLLNQQQEYIKKNNNNKNNHFNCALIHLCLVWPVQINNVFNQYLWFFFPNKAKLNRAGSIPPQACWVWGCVLFPLLFLSTNF